MLAIGRLEEPPPLSSASYGALSGLDPIRGYTFSFGAFSPPAGYLGVITFILASPGNLYTTSTQDPRTYRFLCAQWRSCFEHQLCSAFGVFDAGGGFESALRFWRPVPMPESRRDRLGSVTETPFTTGVPEPQPGL